MCGDLAAGRTVRSLARLLMKFSGVKIYFVSPEVVRMRDDIKKDLARHKIWFSEENNLEKVAPLVDVIYQTRIQKERGSIVSRYGQGLFKITRDILNLMKKDAIVMHPLPRVDEISLEVDADPRAAYFRQAENGLYVRMALLKIILT
jgi:aspartate carbamoyltransferase catalytic subunit